MPFDSVLFSMHRAAAQHPAARARGVRVATVGQPMVAPVVPPPGGVPPIGAPPSAAPAPAPGSRSRLPFVVGFAVLAAGVGYLIYRHEQQEGRMIRELEDELDRSEHHCSCAKTPETRAFPLRENPPAWVRDEEIWERAKLAVRPYWRNYEQPWAVVASVYENMGGKVAA